MSKRRTHSPEFKARVVMEAISGRKTIQEIAADHAIHPIQVSQWKRQLLDGAVGLTDGHISSETVMRWPWDPMGESAVAVQFARTKAVSAVA